MGFINLNKRVTFTNINATTDGYGGQTESDTDIKTVWARVRQRRGLNVVENGVLTAEKDWEVSIRKGAHTPTKTQKIKEGDNRFQITGIVETEDKRYWIITAKELE